MTEKLPSADDATRRDGSRLSEGLGAGAEARCMCKDRAASACPGEWEPGCDLGNNAAYVRVRHMSADDQAAIERSVTVLDDGESEAPNAELSR
jgi:hypothetical protein